MRLNLKHRIQNLADFGSAVHALLASGKGTISIRQIREQAVCPSPVTTGKQHLPSPVVEEALERRHAAIFLSWKRIASAVSFAVEICGEEKSRRPQSIP